MKRYLLPTLLVLALVSPSFSQHIPAFINVTEVDTSPSVWVYKLIFPNASVTNNGDGSVTIATGTFTGGTITGATTFQGTTATFTRQTAAPSSWLMGMAEDEFLISIVAEGTGYDQDFCIYPWRNINLGLRPEKASAYPPHVGIREQWITSGTKDFFPMQFFPGYPNDNNGGMDYLLLAPDYSRFASKEDGWNIIRMNPTDTSDGGPVGARNFFRFTLANAYKAELDSTGKLNLQGGIAGDTTISQIATPTVAYIWNSGTAGATTYGYKVVAVSGSGNTAASAELTTTTGNATLDSTNYNIVTIGPVTGASSYKLYRTTGGATQGLIATKTAPTCDATGTMCRWRVNDTGLAGGGETPESTNTTGNLTVVGNNTYFGDTVGPAVLTFKVTGTDPTLTVQAASFMFPASTYLNFGATAGTTGYGIFDSAGTLQFKHSGGSWFSLAAPGTSGNIAKSDGTNWTSSNSLSVATFDMTSGTSSIPWVVGSGTATNTAEGSAYWESDTDMLTIGDGTTGISLNFTANSVYTFPAATSTLMAQSNEKLASFAWDGGASAVTTGATSKRCTLFPGAATIVGVYAMADASTTTHFHVYQDAFATGARSTTVTGAVDIGATLGSLDTTLTGWDKSITAADEICISVEANDNAKWLNVIVYGTR